ncbi:methyl-accepting chemotaxis sensory transducer, class 40H [Deinococcus grandis]|uniref:Methyl-accepting chemotaxis sensory transducer, class 40H n=1 Tax=Deinococcus grandis TaxID=57498 RepID=A0A100HMI7_9DEIO|nr:methyl-accepting chemotaxis protein [Deinococcus grandis]BBN96570.1 hypothetical protein DEGR_33030 [Deinococcus grandis]GAQ23458.1 methyl-accepting chemotaxis sensory transducer, class 40H [Deinococcus grandis]
MPIRLKLTGVLLLLLLPLLLTGVISVRALDRAALTSADLNRGLIQARTLTNLRAAANRVTLLSAEQLLVPGGAWLDMQDARSDALKELSALPDSARLTAVRQDWAAFDRELSAILDASAPRAQTLRRFERNFEPARQQFSRSVNSYLDAQEATLGAQQAGLAADLRRAHETVLLTGLIGGLLAVLAAWWIVRRLVHAVEAVERSVGRLADGYLDDVPETRSRDEVGRMLRALGRLVAHKRRLVQTMDLLSRGEPQPPFPLRHPDDTLSLAVQNLNRHAQETAAAALAVAGGNLAQDVPLRSDRDALGGALRDMIAQLRAFALQSQDASAQLNLASQSLVAATAQQSTSVHQQSAAIAETTAAVEEVRTTSRHAVDLAGRVSRQADAARVVAEQGVQATRDAGQGMHALQGRVDDIAQNMLHLSRHSRQISEIVETVSELADQSNLLALNAAIEANRAGEHGRGFAVVAQEIRTLAEQSKEAAGQIRRTLEDAQQATNAAVLATEEGSKQAQVGTTLIDRAGQTIEELARVNDDAARMASQIAEAVEQHALSMEQIAVAMNDINEATAQHLNVTQDNQQVARRLQDLVTDLNGHAGRYRT